MCNWVINHMWVWVVGQITEASLILQNRGR